MSKDPGRYLTNLQGATHELFGGDPEEIVLRIGRVAEGARTLRDLARDVRTEADRFERLHGRGWRMMGPFTGGEARCRKTAEPGAAGPARRVPAPAAPPERLHDVVEGAPDLLDAAARLRAAAEAFARLDAEGRVLSDPVGGGRARVE